MAASKPANANEIGNAAVIFAVDNSGSTSGSTKYWSGVDGVLGSVANEQLRAPTTKYLLWNSNCSEVSYSGLKQSVTSRRGEGGTRPQAFAQWIINQANKAPFTLYLITDGEIDQRDVDELDRLVPQLKLVKTVVRIFGSCQADFSVSAPFTRSCECSIAVNEMRVFEGNTKINFEKEYYTVDSFLANFDKIKETVLFANMGIDNEPMRAAILRMKKLYLAEIAKANAERNDAKQLIASLVQSLEANRYEDAMQQLRALIGSQQKGDLAIKVEQKVCEILNLCSLKGQFRPDAVLNTNRATWADDATEVAPAEVELLDVTNQKFECPIILDNDVPVLLVNSSASPILADVEKGITDDLVSCPLTLIKYQQVVEKLKTRIDHTIGHIGFKEMFKNQNAGGDYDDDYDYTAQVLSPMTRNALLGGIPLGCHPQHVKLGDYVLSKLFTDGKLLGNPTLWLCSVYYVIKENVNYLSTNEEFMKQFQTHLIYRLRNYHTFLGLSGLPQYPLVKVPIGVAIWYCVVSSELIKPEAFDGERLLQFFGISALLQHLLDLLGFPFHREATLHRVSVRSVFSEMMRHVKEVASNFRDIIRSLYQNHIKLGAGKYVFLDGGLKSATENRYSDRGLPSTEIVALGSLANASKKIGDVYVPLTLPTVYPRPLTLWPTPTSSGNDTLICVSTMRPYLVDPRDGKRWADRCESVHGLKPQNCLSLYRAYIQCVGKLKAFPTLAEFIHFTYLRQSRRKDRPRDTLPADIVARAGETIDNYERARLAYKANFGETVTPELFKKITAASCAIAARKAIEEAETNMIVDPKELKKSVAPVDVVTTVAGLLSEQGIVVAMCD